MLKHTSHGVCDENLLWVRSYIRCMFGKHWLENQWSFFGIETQSTNWSVRHFFFFLCLSPWVGRMNHNKYNTCMKRRENKKRTRKTLSFGSASDTHWTELMHLEYCNAPIVAFPRIYGSDVNTKRKIGITLTMLTLRLHFKYTGTYD